MKVTWAPAVDGPGSSDAIADAKRKTSFSSPGSAEGSAEDAIASKIPRHKIVLILRLRTSQRTNCVDFAFEDLSADPRTRWTRRKT